jgi:hypothetical protein
MRFFMQDNHVSDNPFDVIVVGTGLQIACVYSHRQPHG